MFEEFHLEKLDGAFLHFITLIIIQLRRQEKLRQDREEASRQALEQYRQQQLRQQQQQQVLQQQKQQQQSQNTQQNQEQILRNLLAIHRKWIYITEFSA